METRSGDRRDAVTVEIAFAVVTGAFAAALVFGVAAGAVRFLELPEIGLRIGAVAACLAFVARVVQVLWRFTPEDPGRTPDSPGGTVPQPSQPGRTSPDS
ncbi:DUF6332 family protein [Streptomyces sp. NPDC059255]|uniref:DUF6332 family protein n=1 Tax=Streptomyces sp. NPDC059255 TaxID=3346793 RepID=UPI0036AFBF17